MAVNLSRTTPKTTSDLRIQQTEWDTAIIQDLATTHPDKDYAAKERLSRFSDFWFEHNVNCACQRYRIKYTKPTAEETAARHEQRDRTA